MLSTVVNLQMTVACHNLVPGTQHPSGSCIHIALHGAAGTQLGGGSFAQCHMGVSAGCSCHLSKQANHDLGPCYHAACDAEMQCMPWCDVQAPMEHRNTPTAYSGNRGVDDHCRHVSHTHAPPHQPVTHFPGPACMHRSLHSSPARQIIHTDHHA